jgi:tetratricopeptide (TPR) repeat protein
MIYTYKEIVEEIKSNRSAIFCGAGISFNSGVPIVPAFLDYLFTKIKLTADQVTLIQQSSLPFESIMEMTLRESGLDEIQEIFSAGNPNENHTFIAKLAKKGLIKIICTTNFDILIEKALQEEGLLPNVNFRVYSFESDFNIIPWESDIIKIIKIHGCVTKKDEMAITMSLIASDRYSTARKKVIQQIFKSDVSNYVIVMGYSCSDIALVPLIESFSGGKTGILFVEHQNVSTDVPDELKFEPVSLKEGKNPFKKYLGKRILVNTDELVKNLWEALVDDQYSKPSRQNISWKDNIDRWYSVAEKESGRGVKHHISSRLLYAVGAFEEAIKYNTAAISIASADNNQLAYASEVGNMGMAFSALGDNEQAKFCLMESIPLCRRMGYLQGLAAQLQALGNVLHRIGDDKKALEAHKEAFHYADMEKDEYAISNILGNMANSYNRLGEYDNAYESVNRALTISRKLGNNQAESSQLGIISYTFLSQGKYQQALESSLSGIRIKKAIGDRQGECLMLANLISIYQILDKREEALLAAKECLNLAKEIGNKQVEMMVTLIM